MFIRTIDLKYFFLCYYLFLGEFMMKRLLIVCVFVFLLLCGLFFINLNRSSTIYKRVYIWNNADGNSNCSKLNDMNIDYNSSLDESLSLFGVSIVGEDYVDIEREVDTLTYFYEIAPNFEKNVYLDEPYLDAYLVKNSDVSVIVVPGGGFGYKSIEYDEKEGKEIANTLNKNGINAFVLHYRSNPYEYPIPYLDLQRAIRYLKYHSDEYGINSEKISLIGYSAGANLITHFINKIQNNDFYSDDYVKDEIDNQDASVTSVALIYPVVTFNYNVPMLFSLFNADSVRNDGTREKLLDLMDNTKHFDSASVRQFVAYSDSDSTVGVLEILKYISKASENGTDITQVLVKNVNHGFGQKYYFNEYINWLINK